MPAIDWLSDRHPSSEDVGHSPAIPLQGNVVESVVHPHASLLGPDQANLLQQLEVLGHGGLRHVKTGGDDVDALGVFAKKPHDLEARLRGESLKYPDLLLYSVIHRTSSSRTCSWVIHISLILYKVSLMLLSSACLGPPDRCRRRDYRYHDTRGAVERMNVSPRALDQWRVKGGGPPFIKMSGGVRYDVAELEQWLGTRRRRSTSDPGPEKRSVGRQRTALKGACLQKHDRPAALPTLEAETPRVASFRAMYHHVLRCRSNRRTVLGN